MEGFVLKVVTLPTSKCGVHNYDHCNLIGLPLVSTCELFGTAKDHYHGELTVFTQYVCIMCTWSLSVGDATASYGPHTVEYKCAHTHTIMTHWFVLEGAWL